MAMSGPIPKYRVKVAYHSHRVGDVIEPTGIWRDQLIRNGFIERVECVEIDTRPALLKPAPTPLRKGRP